MSCGCAGGKRILGEWDWCCIDFSAWLVWGELCGLCRFGGGGGG